MVAIFDHSGVEGVGRGLGLAEEHGLAHGDGVDVADGRVLLFIRMTLNVHLGTHKHI